MVVDVFEHRSEVGPAEALRFPLAVGVEGLIVAEGVDFLDFCVALNDRQLVIAKTRERRSARSSCAF